MENRLLISSPVIQPCYIAGQLPLFWDPGSACDWLISVSMMQRLEVNVGENVCRMRQNPHQRHLVATGGKENDLKVWDLTNPSTPTFKAKNVSILHTCGCIGWALALMEVLVLSGCNWKNLGIFSSMQVRNDWLNLRVPIWVMDMAFLPDSQQIVTCTGHHQVLTEFYLRWFHQKNVVSLYQCWIDFGQKNPRDNIHIMIKSSSPIFQVRVYDPRTTQRRAVLDMEFDEYPLTAMALRPGHKLVCLATPPCQVCIVYSVHAASSLSGHPKMGSTLTVFIKLGNFLKMSMRSDPVDETFPPRDEGCSGFYIFCSVVK